MKEVIKKIQSGPLILTLFFAYILCPLFSDNHNPTLYNIFLYYPFIMLCWYSIYKVIKSTIEFYFKENLNLFERNIDMKENIKNLCLKITDSIYIFLIVAFGFYFILFSQLK